MPKFRKKPIVVEAFRLGVNEPPEWWEVALDLGKAKEFAPANNPTGLSGARISTPEGDMFAEVGDWIIKGVLGELYPCKPGVFDLTYEPYRERT